MASNLKQIYVGVDKSDPNRRIEDLYPTPPIATHILLKYATPPHNIIEPCAGRGHISAELRRQGYNVKSFDLNDHDDKLVNDIISGQDVMQLPAQQGYDAFITNPPYFKDLPRKIAEKGIAEYQYTAMLVRLTFLEGMKRRSLFTRHPPSDIIIFSDRIKFADIQHEPIEEHDQIGGMICYMWIIWDKRKTSTSMKWVSLKEEYPLWRKIYDETPIY